MRVAARYLSVNISAGIAVVLLALTVLLSVIDFIAELDDIAEDSYTLSAAVFYTLLGFVPNIYIFFPIAVLIGGAISLSSLVDRRELMALSVVGYSRYEIGRILLGLCGVLMVFMFLFGEWVVPNAVNKAHQIKYTRSMQDSTIHKTANGYWTRRGANYIFVKSLDSSRFGNDVTVYQINDAQHLQKVFYAQHIHLLPKHLALQDGQLVRLQDDSLASIKDFSEYRIPVPESSDAFETGLLIPEAMNMLQLQQHADFLRQNFMDSRLYELAFWSRLSNVLVIPVMLLLSLLWVFHPPRDDHIRRRVFAAILFGVIYMLFSRLAGNISIVWHLPPAVGAFFPTLLFLLVGGWLFKRLS